MSASDFTIRAGGNMPEEAFGEAKKEAQYDYGHSGYTGTIAEKDEFVEIKEVGLKLLDEVKRAYAEKLINNGDSRIEDKWGPAGMIKLSNGYLFFGWASC